MPLACTACIDIDFQYRFPYAGWAMLVVLIWFGTDAWRDCPEPSKMRRVLTFWGIVLSIAWFGFCMLPLAWGGLLGVVTGFATLRYLTRRDADPRRRKLAGVCFGALVLIGGWSVICSRRMEHQVAWLGRLPTHSNENERPVRIIRAGGERAETLVLQAAEKQLTDSAHPNWNGLGSLAREVSRLNRPESCPLLIRFRDRMLDDLAKNDYLTVGQRAAILACGQSGCPQITDGFREQVEQRLENQDGLGALIFLTAWGLADREAALRWRDSHDMSWVDKASGWRRSEDKALHSMWKDVQAGVVDKQLLQRRIDAFTPACGRYEE